MLRVGWEGRGGTQGAAVSSVGVREAEKQHYHKGAVRVVTTIDVGDSRYAQQPPHMEISAGGRHCEGQTGSRHEVAGRQVK